jgi:hypothetical protein
VKLEHRNKGIGKALFKELAIIAQDKVTKLTPLPDPAIDQILGLRSYGLVCSQGSDSLSVLMSAEPCSWLQSGTSPLLTFMRNASTPRPKTNG